MIAWAWLASAKRILGLVPWQAWVAAALACLVFWQNLQISSAEEARDAARADAAEMEGELIAEMADHSRTLALLTEYREALAGAEEAAADAERVERAARAEADSLRQQIRALPKRSLTDAEIDLYRLVDRLVGGVRLTPAARPGTR